MIKPHQNTPENLSLRIRDYFSNGGLFNPEMMDHDKVRKLLMDIQDYFWAYKRNKIYCDICGKAREP